MRFHGPAAQAQLRGNFVGCRAVRDGAGDLALAFGETAAFGHVPVDERLHARCVETVAEPGVVAECAAQIANRERTACRAVARTPRATSPRALMIRPMRDVRHVRARATR